MVRGLPASILLHVCVIVGATASAPYIGGPALPPPVIVPIELVTAGAVTDIAPVIEQPEPTEETLPPEPNLEDFLGDEDSLPPEADTPNDAVSIPEEAPRSVIEPEPTASEEPILVEPDAEEPPTDEPEPTPEAPKPTPTQAPPPDPLKDILNASRNRLRQESNVKRSDTQTSRQLQDETVPTRRGAGERKRAIASYQSIIATQMKACWADVRDLPNPERLVVTLRVRLNADGTLERDPELINPRRPPIGDRYMQVAIDRAMRATRTCAPYQLPREEYDIWKTLSFAIGPDGS